MLSAGGEDARRIAALVRLPEKEGETIRLPIRFHIITDVDMNKRDVKMSSWVTEAEVRTMILPEINRTWMQAGIEFALESVVVRPGAAIEDREQRIKSVANSKRADTPAENARRVANINALCDKQRNHPVIMNVHLFPFRGETYQGFADLGGNHTVSAIWSDKPSGGRKPPQKYPLNEPLPFKIGSIARTCGHELGHNLTLVHPPKTPKLELRQGRLMGGSRHGNELTAEEVVQARQSAISRARKILDWEATAAGHGRPDDPDETRLLCRCDTCA